MAHEKSGTDLAPKNWGEPQRFLGHPQHPYSPPKPYSFTVVDRETGKESPSEARRIRRNTAIMEQEYVPEMATPGLNSIIRRLVNDVKRQFTGPDRARAMRTARKVADDPRMQETSALGGRVSRPLDAPSSEAIRERIIREMTGGSP